MTGHRIETVKGIGTQYRLLDGAGMLVAMFTRKRDAERFLGIQSLVEAAEAALLRLTEQDRDERDEALTAEALDSALLPMRQAASVAADRHYYVGPMSGIRCAYCGHIRTHEIHLSTSNPAAEGASR